MSNIYFSPEKLGLELVDSVDYSDGDYCFDYRVIWKHIKTGKLYTARDSGCSCPSPFENYKSINDLEDFSADYLIEEARTEQKNYSRADPTDVARFVISVREIEKKYNEQR